MRCFFKNVINGITNEATASALVGQNLSISTIDSVKNNLRALGLVIKTSILNGITYEITAERRAAK
jgi:3-methyladenine DNA glycosylase/8-oxoguanine DNA glycosylase